MKPVVIEFIGLPGSGKSTIAVALSKKLLARGYRCAEPNDFSKLRKDYLKSLSGNPKLAMLLLFFRHLRITISSLLYAVMVKPLNMESLKFASFIPINFFYQQKMKTDSRYDYMLLGQGILQNIWSVSLSGTAPSSNQIKKYLKKISPSLPHFIFFCELDVSSALERIQIRGITGSRFDLMDEEKARKILTLYTGQLKMLAEECGKLSGKEIYEINTAESIEKNTEKIFEFLRNKKMIF